MGKAWSDSIGERGNRWRIFERGKRGAIYLSRGRGHQQSLGEVTRAEASAILRTEYGKWLASSGTGGEAQSRPHGQATVTDLIVAYREHGPKHGAKRESASKRYAAIWTEHFGHRLPSSVTAEALNAYVADRRAGRLHRYGFWKTALPSWRTVKKEVDWLKACFGWTVATKRLDLNPFRLWTKATGRPKEMGATADTRDRARLQVASQEDYQRVRDAVITNPRWKPFIMLARGLGFRATSICTLRMSRFKLDRTDEDPHGLVYMVGEKGGVKGWVGLTRTARAGLDLLLASFPVIGDGWLFPQVQNPEKPWTGEYALKRLIEACAASGVDYAGFRGLHSFRRAWVMELKQAGIAEVDIAFMGGWETIAALRSYMFMDTRTVARGIAALDEAQREVAVG
jgi:hypothetical protein